MLASIVPLISAPSPGNTSTVALVSTDTFTGTGELSPLPDVMVSCQAGNSGTLYFDFSPDGTNWSTFPPNGFELFADTHKFQIARKGLRYFRVRLVNDAGSQGYLRLYIYFGFFLPANAPLNFSINQDADAIVTRTDDEGAVMRRKIKGEYIVNKFSRNPDVDGAEDIWNGGGDYTGFPTATAETFEVFSSSANDTNSSGTGARTVRIWYLDDDYNAFDASGNFLTFDVNLNGTTGVIEGTSGMRVWRAKVISSGSSQTNEGSITIRWSTTTAVIFAVLPAAFGQTELSNFTIPTGYTGYLKRYAIDMEDNTSNSAQMALKSRDFGSNTFVLSRPLTVSTNKSIYEDLYGGVTFEEKTDFCFRCLSVVNSNGIINVRYDLRLERNG